MSSVLYDTPGPRARRRTLVGSLVIGTVLLGVITLAVVQLIRRGQFTAQQWGPLLNPDFDTFRPVWHTLAGGMANTLNAAAWAILFSVVVGTLLAVLRITASAWWRWLVVGVIELLRGIPVAITIIFVWQVLPLLGIELSLMWDLVIGLTLYNSVIIAEIVRAGVDSLPHGQTEAAQSLGLRRAQILAHVQLPQAFRVMLPALISQLVVVLKDTSLGFAIGYAGLVASGNRVHLQLDNPLQVLFLVAVMFIVINYSLSKFATYLENRLTHGKKAPTHDAAETIVGETESSGA